MFKISFIIFAWSGALAKRGEIDNNKELIDFAHLLEKSTIDTINCGFVTKDLYNMSTVNNKKIVNTNTMIDEIFRKLENNI